MSEPIALTERQWDVWEGILAQKSVSDIATDMGGVTASYVTMLRAELRDLGLIRRRGDLPAHGRYEDVYPWEPIAEQPPLYKPSMPPRAKLRLEYAQTSDRDLTVPPIRHVWWQQWSVQGIPMTRPVGGALSGQRVVVVTELVEPHWQRGWVVAQQPWLESQTELWVPGIGVTVSERQAMTLLIAAAIGVESVLDLTPVKEPRK